MSKLRLITAFLFAIFMVLGVTAQVHTQKGIVRKVTRSASDPFIPVQGVQVIVSGEANKASDKDGRFSLKVKVTDKAGSYTLTAVRVPQGSKYMLASPSKGKRLFISANDLEVSLITPEEKEMEYKKRYELLKEKYEEQSLSLRKLRNELNKRLGELSESVQDLSDIYCVSKAAITKRKYRIKTEKMHISDETLSLDAILQSF